MPGSLHALRLGEYQRELERSVASGNVMKVCELLQAGVRPAGAFCTHSYGRGCKWMTLTDLTVGNDQPYHWGSHVEIWRRHMPTGLLLRRLLAAADERFIDAHRARMGEAWVEGGHTLFTREWQRVRWGDYDSPCGQQSM